MKDYKEIETLEIYAKVLTLIVILVSATVLILTMGKSFIVGIVCGLVTFAVGYMGICALRVFAGIARDIRDMRNGQTGQRDGGKQADHTCPGIHPVLPK